MTLRCVIKNYGSKEEGKWETSDCGRREDVGERNSWNGQIRVKRIVLSLWVLAAFCICFGMRRISAISIREVSISGDNSSNESDNCTIAVSNFTEYSDDNQLVGIFCKSDMSLYFHFKGNLLNQNYTGMKKTSLSQFKEPNKFFSNGRYIMIGGISSTIYHNVRAVITNSTIQLIANNLNGYIYNDLASANEISLNIVTNISGNYWILYLMSGSNNYIYTLNKDLPYSIAMRDLGNSLVSVYFTSIDNYVSKPTPFTLTKLISSYTWNITYSSSVSLMSNCGSQILINQDLIVLSCPSYFSSFSTITILKESTLETVYILNSTSVNLNIGNIVYFDGVFTTYYRIIFPLMQTASNCPLNNCSIALGYYSNYPYYGQFFTFDNTNMMYLTGSANSTGGNDLIYSKWCMPNEIYNSTTGNCIAISSIMYNNITSVSFDVQSPATKCKNIDDTITRNRLIGESFCNFGCSSLQFGKNCESCSVYMNRVGVSLPSGYYWDNTNNYVCEARAYNTSQTCSIIASCSDCMLTSSCNYENYKCVSSSSNEISVSNQNWVMVYSYCTVYSNPTEISAYCGNTTYDLDKLSDISSIKLKVLTPQNTICKFSLSSSSRSVITNDTFTITYDNTNEDVYFEIVTPTGSLQSITGISSRNLDVVGNERMLSTIKYSYTFVNASSINIYYYSKTNHTPAWQVSSALNFTSSSSGSSSSGSSSSSSSSTSSTNQSPVDGSLNNITNAETAPTFSPTVLIVVSITGLTIVILIAIFAYIKRKTIRKICGDRVINRRAYTAPRPGERWSNADVEFFILFNVEKDYCKEINKFKTKECAICLSDFELGSKVRVMPVCQHLFHSSCIVEVVRFARVDPKCPLCNRPLSIADESENEEEAKEDQKQQISIHEYQPVDQSVNQLPDIRRNRRRRRIVNP